MNKIRNFCTVVVFFFFASAFAQETVVDSLQKVLKNSNDGILQLQMQNLRLFRMMLKKQCC